VLKNVKKRGSTSFANGLVHGNSVRLSPDLHTILFVKERRRNIIARGEWPEL
jgi:hypothetical protein